MKLSTQLLISGENKFMSADNFIQPKLFYVF